MTKTVEKPYLLGPHIPIQYILVLKASADWLVKLRISCAIYLRAIREKMASRFASATRRNPYYYFFFGVYYLTVLVYTKTIRGSVNIHRQPPPLRSIAVKYPMKGSNHHPPPRGGGRASDKVARDRLVQLEGFSSLATRVSDYLCEMHIFLQ